MKDLFTKREFQIIFLIQVTEILGFSLILPFLPLYAQEFGASPFVISMILSLFSLLQFFSAPILGRLSDFYGRRPLLIISQVSTFISFIVLGVSNSLWMIFVSRAIDGLFGSNFTIAQAYISDITSKKDRSKAFGVTGLAFGVGFLLGPAIGGYLATFGYAVPSFFAAFVALTTVFATYYMLPETIAKKEHSTADVKIIDIQSFTKYFKSTIIACTLLQFFLYIVTHVIWTSNFALFSEKQLGFTSREIGFVLAYVGFISIILRGGVLPKLIDTLHEDMLKNIGIITIIIGFLAMAQAQSFRFAMVAFTLFAFGNGILRPLLMGTLSRLADPKEQGAVIGVANSLGSVAQIIGPLIGGFLLTNYAPPVLLYVAAGVMMLSFVFIVFQKRVCVKS